MSLHGTHDHPLQFSHNGQVLYITAGDVARIKIFAIPVPETPSVSSTDPSLATHIIPTTLTHTGAAQSIQPLSNGRLLFTRSTLTSPNDVFVIRGLPAAPQHLAESVSDIKIEQLTKFTADALHGKTLSEGEDFWFDGAERKIHGWIVKPPGFKEGEKKKWPILLFIHGGPQGAWEDQWSTRWNPNSQSFRWLSCQMG